MQKAKPRMKKKLSTEIPKPSFIHNEKFKVGVPTGIVGMMVVIFSLFFSDMIGEGSFRDAGVIAGILVGVVPLTMLQVREDQRKDSSDRNLPHF